MKTPRTDAMMSVPMTRADSDDFARTLERDLVSAKRENAALREALALSQCVRDNAERVAAYALKKRKQAEADRDTARAALRKGGAL